MPSGAAPHSLHAESLLSLSHVLWMVYNHVGVCIGQVRQSLAVVCVGQVRQSLSYEKHRSALSSSSIMEDFIIQNTNFHKYNYELSGLGNYTIYCVYAKN